MQHKVKCITDFPPATEYNYNEDLWHHQHGDAFVIINCRASSIYYPEHWTPLSLKCAFNGKEYYKLKNTTYAVGDANFLVMNQGSQYASYILSDSVTESLTLNFTQYNLSLLASANYTTGLQLLDDPFKLKNGSTTFIEKLYAYNPAVSFYIQQLKTFIAQRHTDNFAITEILYSILEEIVQLNGCAIQEANGIAAKKKVTREELYRRLSIAKDYLSSCYYEQITIDQLAATCYLNPFYLIREFKKLYNITPHQFLTKLRLREAEKMIANSQKQISGILQEVGFEDLTSFSKLFKKEYGVSPMTYRKQAK